MAYNNKVMQQNDLLNYYLTMNINNICRICLEKGPKLMPIFDPIKPPHFSILIMACAAVQVLEGDGLPPYICQKCISKLNIAFQFKTQCESSEAKLRQCFSNYELQVAAAAAVPCLNESVEEAIVSSSSNVEQLQPVSELAELQQVQVEQPPTVVTFVMQETSPVQDLQEAQLQLDSGPSLHDLEKTTLTELKLELNDLKTHDLGLKVEELVDDPMGVANSNKSKKPIKQHQCDTCGKVFRSKPSLVHHIRIHTGERPYVCHLCDKRFINGGHLHTHMRTHTGEKNHVCAACSKAFSTAQQLTKHTIAIHTSERPYACTYCPKRFASSSNLHTHIKIHTGEKNYHCDQCGKAFSTKGQLYQHMLIHTGEKAFLCEYCNKRFSQKAHLVRHLKTHKS